MDADASQLILAAHVTRTPSDADGLPQAQEAATEKGLTIERMIADSGYVNADAIEEIGKQIDLYVAVTDADRQYDF